MISEVNTMLTAMLVMQAAYVFLGPIFANEDITKDLKINLAISALGALLCVSIFVVIATIVGESFSLPKRYLVECSIVACQRIQLTFAPLITLASYRITIGYCRIDEQQAVRATDQHSGCHFEERRRSENFGARRPEHALIQPHALVSLDS